MCYRPQNDVHILYLLHPRKFFGQKTETEAQQFYALLENQDQLTESHDSVYVPNFQATFFSLMFPRQIIENYTNGPYAQEKMFNFKYNKRNAMRYSFSTIRLAKPQLQQQILLVRLGKQVLSYIVGRIRIWYKPHGGEFGKSNQSTDAFILWTSDPHPHKSKMTDEERFSFWYYLNSKNQK